MTKVKGLKCIKCGREHGLNEAKYVCSGCGGNLQVVYDYKSIGKRISRKRFQENHDRSIWRYFDILPLEDLRHIPLVHIGWTPLYKAERLGREFGLSNVYLKDDGRNPSASFKDRAGAVAVARALELGERTITGASTGNAASSLACLTSGIGLKTIIFVPQAAPVAKIAQILVFGAVVIAVKGTYDQAFDICLKATEEYGWYNRNTGYNPFTREGKKTCSFEIVEQMAWKCPDKVFVPVGDGNIISGIWKGFVDFHNLGLIEKLPQLVAVQAEKSDSVKRAFESDGVIRPVSGETVADSISVSLPRDGDAAVKALKESKGFAVSVSDGEILEAIKTTARCESVFGEPAGVASVAGLKKAVSCGLVKSHEKVVVLVTGNGLKDVASAMKAVAATGEVELRSVAKDDAVGKPHLIEPEVSELRRLVKQLNL